VLLHIYIATRVYSTSCHFKIRTIYENFTTTVKNCSRYLLHMAIFHGESGHPTNVTQRFLFALTFIPCLSAPLQVSIPFVEVGFGIVCTADLFGIEHSWSAEALETDIVLGVRSRGVTSDVRFFSHCMGGSRDCEVPRNVSTLFEAPSAICCPAFSGTCSCLAIRRRMTRTFLGVPCSFCNIAVSDITGYSSCE